MKQNVTFPLTGGLDRSVRSNVASRDSFFNLYNFRQRRGTLGLLEQTPYFQQYGQFSQGTYYDGGSLTEPTGSNMRYFNGTLFMTDYVFNVPIAGQIQAFYQTTFPAAETIHTGCRLVINSVSGLGLTLGSTLDVVIEAGGASFKYRKNGGAYTTGVAITTAGVSIDGGNATLYFLASSGFTVADTWSWTRTDASYSVSANKISASGFTPSGVTYKEECFFTSPDRRIMVQTVTSSAQYYVISAGYRPVYGCQVIIFDDHLVVGGFDRTAAAYGADNRDFVLGWSDKTDLHNFIPTDVNEADQHTLVYNLFNSTPPTHGILGFAVLKQQLFVITNVGIFYTPSLGLPSVFDFQYYFTLPLGVGGGTTVVQANLGIYILGANDIYYFDGAHAKSVARGIIDLIDTSSIIPYNCLGQYSITRQELVVYDPVTKLFLCYQEDNRLWYTRAGSFATAVSAFFVNSSDVYYIGQASRTVFTQSTLNNQWTTQPVMDESSGAAYATPKMTLQLTGDQIHYVKEIVSSHLGFYSVITTVSATYFSTGTNLQAKLYWYAKSNPDPAGLVSPSTDSNAVLLVDATDGTIPYPRVDGRVLAVEVQLVGLVNGKPPGQGGINALELMITNPTPLAVR